MTPFETAIQVTKIIFGTIALVMVYRTMVAVEILSAAVA